MLNSRVKTLLQCLQIGVFVLPLFFGCFRLFFPENARPFQHFPEIRPKEFRLGEYAKSFEAYVNNNFGIRSRLLDAYGPLLYAVFHQSLSDQALAGKGNWFFYTQQGSLEDMLGRSLLTPEQRAQWETVLRTRAENLARRGIAYRLVVVPDKHSLYPEELPDRVHRHLGMPRLRDFLEQTRTALPLLCLQTDLEREKHRSPLPVYYQTDTHWTSYGALLGARTILADLGIASGQAVTRLGPQDYRTVPGYQGDLSRIAKAGATEPSVALEDGQALRASVHFRQLLLPAGVKRADILREGYTAINAQGTGSAMVFQDSFGPALEPYLYATFHRTSFCWAYPDDPAFYAYVEQEKPDVVLEIRVERLFGKTPRLDQAAWDRPPPAGTSIAGMLAEDGRLEVAEGLLRIVTRQGIWAEGPDTPGAGGSVDALSLVDGSLVAQGRVRVASEAGQPLWLLAADGANILFSVEVTGRGTQDDANRLGTDPAQTAFRIDFPAALLPADVKTLRFYRVGANSVARLAQ